MRRAILAFTGSLFLLSSPLLHHPIEQAKLRAVWIETEIGIGSGVAIRSGLVLTNRHVVEGSKNIRVDGKIARVLRRSDRADLALLAVPTRALPPVRIQTRTAVGDKVFYVGNPGGNRDYVGQGRILDYPEGRIHSSAFAWGGFSGSGLYNDSGDLVGIQTEWTAFLGSSPDGLAIPASAVIEFLKR